VSAFSEEVSQQGRPLILEHSQSDLELVIQPRVIHDVVKRQSGSGARVLRAENKPPDAGQYQRAGAHGTGLESDVHGHTIEPPAADPLGGPSESQDLSMSGCVALQLSLVVRRAQDLAVAHQKSAYRYVAMVERKLRLPEREAHEVVIGRGFLLAGHSVPGACYRPGWDRAARRF
jgi:hypothetical protein